MLVLVTRTCYGSRWSLFQEHNMGLHSPSYKQGSTKLLSLLSEIRETPKSLRNFFLERTSKKEKNMCVSDKLEFLWNFETQKQVSLTETCISHRNKFLLQKKFSLTETIFSHRNKFLSQKQFFSHRNNFLSQKQFSLTETRFSPKTGFSHRKKFFTQKQASLSVSNEDFSFFCREFGKKKFTHIQRNLKKKEQR